MTASIRQVAARAGVSPATVSRVLNSTDVQIALGTRAKVEKAARELEYHPHAAARALARRQSDTLGVVLPPAAVSPFYNPFFGALLDGVLSGASKRHFNIMVFTAQTGEGTMQHRNLGQMRDGRCDGLLVFYQPMENDILPALLDAGIPCVLVSDWRSDPRLPCVDVENTDAAQQMTEHLLALGHRRIALLTAGPFEVNSEFTHDRIKGHHRAWTARGLPAPDPALLLTGLTAWDIPSVFDRIETLLSGPHEKRPTALLCLGDDLASLCVAALNRMGLRVPEDVSVTGFNDDLNALRQNPALTTVRQPYEDLGGCAIDLLLERISGGIDTPVRKIRLPTELVVRGSTAPPPRAPPAS